MGPSDIGHVSDSHGNRETDQNQKIQISDNISLTSIQENSPLKLISMRSAHSPGLSLIPYMDTISNGSTQGMTHGLHSSNIGHKVPMAQMVVNTQSPPMVPIPHIPTELRKSLSEMMFGPTARLYLPEIEKKEDPPAKISHQCQVCQKTFSRPCSLKTHMYTHTGEKPYGCPHKDCSHRFSVRSNLKRHISVVHEGKRAKAFK